MELFIQLGNRQTNRQTNGLTELFLKSLSRLKNNLIEILKIKTSKIKRLKRSEMILKNTAMRYSENLKFLI